MWARIKCNEWWKVVEVVGPLNQSKWGRKTWITTKAFLYIHMRVNLMPQRQRTSQDR